MRKHLAVDSPGRLIIFQEKHAKRYFLAETKEQLCAIALSILKERLRPEYGYITKPGKPSDYYSEKDLLTDEQIAALPTAALVKLARDARHVARQYKSWYERDCKHYMDGKKAVKEKNGELAWEILDERSTGEYEGYTFEYLEKP